MVLESWMESRRVQEVAARFQGIPSWVLLELPIPQKAAMEVLEAWFFTKRGWRMILEAWYYTRAVQVWSWRPGMTPGRRRGGPRGLVLHQGGWDRCGPRGDDWLDPNGC